MRLRISLVNYLNAAPLGWYFLHGPMRHTFQVVPATPARCAEQLANGEVDIGLIPSIEYQRIPGLQAIPGVGVAATDEVRSVIMIRPPGSTRLRSVALDTSSRTSVALVRLLLQSKMGLRPEFVPHEPRVREMLQKCDAALVIGDTALRCSPSEYEIMDLAAAWHEWQRKPFVFAVWGCRPEAAATDGLAELFQEARNWGVTRIEEIAASHSRSLELPASFLEQYLRRNLEHTLTPEHEEGLDRFYRLAFESGMTDSLKPVSWVGSVTGKTAAETGKPDSGGLLL